MILGFPNSTRPRGALRALGLLCVGLLAWVQASVSSVHAAPPAPLGVTCLEGQAIACLMAGVSVRKADPKAAQRWFRRGCDLDQRDACLWGARMLAARDPEGAFEIFLDHCGPRDRLGCGLAVRLLTQHPTLAQSTPLAEIVGSGFAACTTPRCTEAVSTADLSALSGRQRAGHRTRCLEGYIMRDGAPPEANPEACDDWLRFRTRVATGDARVTSPAPDPLDVACAGVPGRAWCKRCPIDIGLESSPKGCQPALDGCMNCPCQEPIAASGPLCADWAALTTLAAPPRAATYWRDACLLGETCTGFRRLQHVGCRDNDASACATLFLRPLALSPEVESTGRKVLMKACGDGKFCPALAAHCEPDEPCVTVLEARAKELFKQARLHRRAERFAAAVGAYREVIVLGVPSGRAWAGIGWVAFLAEHYSLASWATHKGLATSPNRSLAWMLTYNLGRIYQAFGQPQKAMDAYEAALVLKSHPGLKLRLRKLKLMQRLTAPAGPVRGATKVK